LEKTSTAKYALSSAFHHYLTAKYAKTREKKRIGLFLFAFFGFVRGSLSPTSFNHQHLSPLVSDSRLNSFNYQRLTPLASISRQKSFIANCSLLIARRSRGDFYRLETEHFLPETEHFLLETEHFLLETEHFLLETEHFLLETERFL
jgi:hypothetical protein